MTPLALEAAQRPRLLRTESNFQSGNFTRWNPIDLGKFLNERMDLSETKQRTADLRPALDERSIPEPVERALDAPL